MAAFQLALQKGADGIETDLRLSKDGHIVLFHDEVRKPSIPTLNYFCGLIEQQMEED